MSISRMADLRDLAEVNGIYLSSSCFSDPIPPGLVDENTIPEIEEAEAMPWAQRIRKRAASAARGEFLKPSQEDEVLSEDASAPVELQAMWESSQSIRNSFDIFLKVSSVIQEFDLNTQDLRSLSNTVSIEADDDASSTRLFNTLYRVQNRSLVALKRTIEEISVSNQLHAQLDACHLGSEDPDDSEMDLEQRIRLNLTRHLVVKTVEVTQRYQDAIAQHSAAMEDQTTRRFRLLYPNLSDHAIQSLVRGSLADSTTSPSTKSKSVTSEPSGLRGMITPATKSALTPVPIAAAIEELMKHPHPDVSNMDDEGKVVLNLFASVQEDPRRIEALRHSYDELAEKLHDVKKLESNVDELYQMFIDLAALVQQGQEHTDSIEFQLLKAADHVVETIEALSKARISQKKRNKRAMHFSGIILVVFLVIILSVVLSFTKGG